MRDSQCDISILSMQYVQLKCRKTVTLHAQHVHVMLLGVTFLDKGSCTACDHCLTAIASSHASFPAAMSSHHIQSC